ncbi:MAG: hypothetical protein PVF17_00875 [Ignavibacteria bacterium]|jgi:hypothetical protein
MVQKSFKTSKKIKEKIYKKMHQEKNQGEVMYYKRYIVELIMENIVNGEYKKLDVSSTEIGRLGTSSTSLEIKKEQWERIQVVLDILHRNFNDYVNMVLAYEARGIQ